MEIDGSVRIAWLADGLAGIRVTAPGRPRGELDDFARQVADLALLERSVHGLRLSLRERYPGMIETQVRDITRDAGGPYLLVTLRPPRREPRPEAAP